MAEACRAIVRPPALQPGDTIALVAPSRPSDPCRLAGAISWLEHRGYRVRRASHIHDEYFYLAGADEDRARDVMDAFLDDGIAGILCVRGGFGTGRMVDLLDYDAIAAHPKVFIGFSDSTGLQLALYARAGLVTFTGALADTDLGSASVDSLLENSLRRLVEQKHPLGPLPADSDTLEIWHAGKAAGPLVAANLALYCSLLGTRYSPCIDGSVLLLEDVSEAPYRVDRMLSQLRLAGVFDRLAALVLGTFRDCFQATEMASSPTLEEIVLDAVGQADLPIMSGVAYGHMQRRTVLPIGVDVLVDGYAGTVVVTERAVD
jgi:muramoyltetrapeptide carboxypeptidase